MRFPGARAAMAGLLLAFTALSCAQAQGLLHRRAGLWDVDNGRLEIHTCVGGEDDQLAAHQGKCDPPQVGHTLTGFTFHRVCQTGATRSDVTGTITGDFSSNFTMHLKMTATPPMQYFPNGMELTMTQHFLGACPADMKPGDTRRVALHNMN